METSKQIFEHDKRVKNSKDVILRFNAVSKDNEYQFKVYKDDGITPKYRGKIGSNGLRDSCSCPIFHFGMKFYRDEKSHKVYSHFQNENGFNFSCKHLICAKSKLVRMNIQQ